MRHFINIVEDAQVDLDLMNVWGLLDHYGINHDLKSDWHDLGVEWHNRNSRRAIDKMISDPRMVLISRIALWAKHMAGVQYPYRDKFATPEMFEQALTQPITVWRGGGGTYDPALPLKRRWVSYTAVQSKVVTFSEYDGTRASRAYVLPKRQTWWVAQLTLPLNKVLGYVDAGFDEEVIVPRDLSARDAKIIKTHQSE